MYFVIQVMVSKEKDMMDQICKNIDSSLVLNLFVPTRERMKKINKKWVKYEERCFPGYIFIETNKPKEVAKELRKINGFTKLVGFGDIGKISYIPLSNKEEVMINKLLGKDEDNTKIKLSRVTISEGKKVKVIDGPLIGFEGTVIKYNLHKRTAMVDIDFDGKIISVQLGIDVVE